MPKSSLKEYRSKRLFKKTPEPTGGRKTKKSDFPRFVIQMHAASRLHFDLRLEVDGVFKSWAVPKGPSLNPLDQRLAVKVEDHPLDYGDFEGSIPSGNYGAGTVLIWDSGTYLERNSSSRKDTDKAMREGLTKGHLTFVLEGQKLLGEFALIRLKDDPKSWLLIKKRDSYAVYRGPGLDATSVASGRTLEEIRNSADATWVPAKKRRVSGAKAGRGSKSRPIQAERAPAVAKGRGLVLPSVATNPPSGEEWLFSQFGSGVRVAVDVDDKSVRIATRHHVPVHDRYPKIVSALGRLGLRATFDGEIVGEAASARLRLLDIAFLNGKDLRDEPLEKRLAVLKKLSPSSPLELVTTADSAEVPWLARKAGSAYRPGISKGWLRSVRGARPGGSHRGVRDEGPVLTHPDKIYWPKELYTKADLAAYYKGVSGFLLPHLKDRPQSLHRFPEGIEKPGFYQKDLSGYHPRWVKKIPVFSESSDRTIHYALCQDERSLLFLVNLGCIEMNPWLSRVSDLDSPDYCVIDIDPDEQSFDDVIKVALETHRVLENLDVPHVCKTSGASGMHIFIPLAKNQTYDESRELAKAVCEIVQQALPRLTTTERTPAKRGGRIYLDALQNSRGQTIASAYSVRPLPGAPVSTPLAWREVKKGLRPAKFNIETVPVRLKKQGDPWERIEGSVKVEAVLKKLRKGLGR